ncbi:NAD(P)/FAD-dependent oxidoreductase [Thioalkalivibrio sp. HK1]|uniref:NAD(P)/FAD-dependent oxidoreductase n=1 Tax=Thioalkalivibrio sp. HK1 TaxID=1469245 RepID=UPI000686CBA4|nr:FAD-binding oxidoreductase [Thioalkalivibrio sp. HK1]
MSTMPSIPNLSSIRFDDPLPEAVDVVVIGGGIVGVSTAWFLARRGVRVALIDKGRIAAEQSSRNWGWIRQQGRDPAEIPIAMESRRIWEGLARETGERDLTFTVSGCLYLSKDKDSLEGHEAWRERAKEYQLDTEMLSADQARGAAPGIEGHWVGGLLTKSDGRAEPFVAVPALARAAQRVGALITEGCAARTIESENGEVCAVHTERGRIRCESAVLSAGVWTSIFAGNLGLDLPQLGVRSSVGRTGPAPDAGLPNLFAPGLALRRREDGGYTVTTGDIAEHFLGRNSLKYAIKYLPLVRKANRDIRLRLKSPADWPGAWGAKTRWSADEITPFERMRILNPAPSAMVKKRLLKSLRRCAPWLLRAGIADFWAGVIDVSPDAVPYLCHAPSPAGLVIGTGMSGHGFGIGPAAGRILADLVQNRPVGHDLSRFRFERFSDGSRVSPGPY